MIVLKYSYLMYFIALIDMNSIHSVYQYILFVFLFYYYYTIAKKRFTFDSSLRSGPRLRRLHIIILSIVLENNFHYVAQNTSVLIRREMEWALKKQKKRGHYYNR